MGIRVHPMQAKPQAKEIPIVVHLPTNRKRHFLLSKPIVSSQPLLPALPDPCF